MTAAISQTVYVVLAIVTTFVAGALATSIYTALKHSRRERAVQPGSNGARGALALLADALAATHNPRALLAVILDATVEATGAPGGMIVVDDDTLISVGDVGATEPLVFPLSDELAKEPLQLVLYPAAGGLPEEMQQLAASIARQGRVALDNARLHRMVEEQALTDDLTGIANRRRFLQALGAEVSRTERFGGHLSVVLADLDEFKQVNDRFGHEGGDVVLRQVAAILQGSLRDVDLPARLGGEEFGVVVPETDSRGARAVAERVRKALKSRPIPVRGSEEIVVTASFGIASFPSASTPAELLRAADAALYRAKAQGKDQTVASGD
jgi:diguanylate cyclase (GGDEF)-like protein